jgi:hypothetical protein
VAGCNPEIVIGADAVNEHKVGAIASVEDLVVRLKQRLVRDDAGKPLEDVVVEHEAFGRAVACDCGYRHALEAVDATGTTIARRADRRLASRLWRSFTGSESGICRRSWFLAFVCPARGRRVQGPAGRRTRSAPPTLDPAPAHAGSGSYEDDQDSE